MFENIALTIGIFVIALFLVAFADSLKKKR